MLSADVGRYLRIVILLKPGVLGLLSVFLLTPSLVMTPRKKERALRTTRGTLLLCGYLFVEVAESV